MGAASGCITTTDASCKIPNVVSLGQSSRLEALYIFLAFMTVHATCELIPFLNISQGSVQCKSASSHSVYSLLPPFVFSLMDVATKKPIKSCIHFSQLSMDPLSVITLGLIQLDEKIFATHGPLCSSCFGCGDDWLCLHHLHLGSKMQDVPMCLQLGAFL